VVQRNITAPKSLVYCELLFYSHFCGHFEKNGCLLFFRLWNGSTASIKHKFDAKITILAILWHKTRQNSWFGYTLAAILDFCQTGSCTTCTPCENQTCSCVDWYPQVSWNPHKVQFSSDIELVAPKLHFHNKFLSKNNTFSELDFTILSPFAQTIILMFNPHRILKKTYVKGKGGKNDPKTKIAITFFLLKIW